jgi:hypothetical protein
MLKYILEKQTDGVYSTHLDLDRDQNRDVVNTVMNHIIISSAKQQLLYFLRNSQLHGVSRVKQFMYHSYYLASTGSLGLRGVIPDTVLL